MYLGYENQSIALYCCFCLDVSFLCSLLKGVLSLYLLPTNVDLRNCLKKMETKEAVNILQEVEITKGPGIKNGVLKYTGFP